jgi:hypothetical protein
VGENVDINHNDVPSGEGPREVRPQDARRARWCMRWLATGLCVALLGLLTKLHCHYRLLSPLGLLGTPYSTSILLSRLSKYACNLPTLSTVINVTCRSGKHNKERGRLRSPTSLLRTDSCGFGSLLCLPSCSLQEVRPTHMCVKEGYTDPAKTEDDAACCGRRTGHCNWRRPTGAKFFSSSTVECTRDD